MELVPFWNVEGGDNEAANFLKGRDWEGGIAGLWDYGGVSVFPDELKPYAQRFGDAYEALNAAIEKWANERGVSV